MPALNSSAKRFQNVLKCAGFHNQVVEMPETTRTASEAAQTIGCQVNQIVKSIIFKTKKSEKPVLVITSGSNRVDEKKVAAIIGEKLGKADADFVRQKTGYAIGGVPPAGHTTTMLILIDEDLMGFEEIWAAAGTPYAVFKLTPDELLRLTKANPVNIKKEK
ncbi:MAG: YbaK/EbsC family protein [Anaerolineaceae bacterium]|nr:YbaK/EbsC family protein [Anaerolineaceae bacterium]